MLKERAGYYYAQDDRNCAESMLLGANDVYELGVDVSAAKLIAGFGGGMGCGGTCGALAGGISVLGALMVKEKAHKTEGFSAACKEFVRRFEEEMESRECADIRKIRIKEGKRCLDTVETAAEILETYLKELKLV